MVGYTVWAEFDDPDVRSRFREWLVREHIGQVIDAGAAEADLLEHPGDDRSPGGRLEVRYLFASSEAQETYLATKMPGLRSETLRLFGNTPGIRYERIDAAVIGRFRANRR